MSTERDPLKEVIREVMDWGRSYGTRLNLPELTRDDVAGQFADKARAAMAEQAATEPALKDRLTDAIAQALALTYHCTRVWDAWNVGTMSQEDFEPVDESDTPAEIADIVLSMLSMSTEKAAPHSEYFSEDGPIWKNILLWHEHHGGIDSGLYAGHIDESIKNAMIAYGDARVAADRAARGGA